MLKKPHLIASAAPSDAPVPPCDCDRDPIEALKQMFVDYAQGKALAKGRDPATRPVFLRLHGVAHGRFVIEPNLPEHLHVGVFAPGREYPVWVRFSSDLQPGAPDRGGTVGVAIKLFDVPGKKLLAPEGNAVTHDFILQNHDVFFVDTAKDMCEFTCQSLDGKGDEYLAAHPRTADVLKEMEKDVASVLNTSYWSVLPFRFGSSRFVKYKLEPEQVPDGDATVDFNDPFYLRGDLYRRLKVGEARFRFLVQLQTNEEEMPLDRATVRWSEQASPPIHLATLILPAQDLETRNQSVYGENLSFNTWRVLAEHEPVGSIAAARMVVYRASAEVRRNFNATPTGEPAEPRPGEWKEGVPYPPAKDSHIVLAKIHPAIGVARVGNSPEHFIGPETIEPASREKGFYRDSQGRLKRQAARFRIFGYNAAGEVVRELTPDWAKIRWNVHVANRKAAWYQWTMSLDVEEAKGQKIPRRNAHVKGDQRKELVIDGDLKSIEGKGTQGSDYHFCGRFVSTDVYLGEIQTDESGRLVFLGGKGISASPTHSPILPPGDNGFINADGWYDDICDGPVGADVWIEGQSVPVESAWVVTAPPNYAPDLVGVRTLYDLLTDLYLKNDWWPYPAQVSFRKDVYPILRRLSGLQWVNHGFAVQFGHGGANNFLDADYVAKLARDPNAEGYDLYREMRHQVFRSFRDPQGSDGNQLPWPWIYGDAMDDPPGNSPRQNASVSDTQFRILKDWADSNFKPDWDELQDDFGTLEKVPLPDQPAVLDRAALEFCLADAFHPGCEVTWPIRHLSLYSSPFRIRHRPPQDAEPDYGVSLTPEIALSPTGPLHEQGPGDLTRWMGLPWQADTGYCRAGYTKQYDEFVPAFWPARVPNHVLTEPNYQVVMDESKPLESRQSAFVDRMHWAEEALHGSTSNQMEQMVQLFGDMGLVESRDGPQDTTEFPTKMMVASFGPQIKPPLPPTTPEEPSGGPCGTPPQRPSMHERGRRLEKLPIPIHRSDPKLE
jgi:hypothetical protein